MNFSSARILSIGQLSSTGHAYTFDAVGDSNHTDADNFHNENNPGFEGVAGQGSSSVPDAGSSIALFGMGFSAVAMLRRSMAKA